MASLAELQLPLRTNEGANIAIDENVIMSPVSAFSPVRRLFSGEKWDLLVDRSVISCVIVLCLSFYSDDAHACECIGKTGARPIRQGLKKGVRGRIRTPHIDRKHSFVKDLFWV